MPSMCPVLHYLITAFRTTLFSLSRSFPLLQPSLITIVPFPPLSHSLSPFPSSRHNPSHVTDEFESRSASLIAQLEVCVLRCLEEAGLSKSDLHEVEIVGTADINRVYRLVSYLPHRFHCHDAHGTASTSLT